MKQYNSYTGNDMTIVVCAYGECPYLEESLQAVLKQTVPTKVLISTSTPNEWILKIAEKHEVEVRVNPNGGQVKDYNFAMEQIKTPIGMLAHQDDILDHKFVEKNLYELNRSNKPIISFCNYAEMHDDVIDEKPTGLLKIKRLMLFPLKWRKLGNTVFGKRLIQCLGDPITHPTVVCVMKEMPNEVYRERFKASMDWDLWERLSWQKGSFVYVPDILLYHRMNDSNQTVKLLESTNHRYIEESEVMGRFWPKAITRLIMYFYSKATKYY